MRQTEQVKPAASSRILYRFTMLFPGSLTDRSSLFQPYQNRQRRTPACGGFGGCEATSQSDSWIQHLPHLPPTAPTERTLGQNDWHWMPPAQSDTHRAVTRFGPATSDSQIDWSRDATSLTWARTSGTSIRHCPARLTSVQGLGLQDKVPHDIISFIHRQSFSFTAAVSL